MLVSLFFLHGLNQIQPLDPVNQKQTNQKTSSYWILIPYRSIQQLGIWANSCPKNEKKYKKKKKQPLYKISESESESYVSPTLGYWFFRTAYRERLLWND